MIKNVEEEKKILIAKSIKNIDLETVDREMDKLIEIGANIGLDTISPRSRIGNNIVDYFTFLQRLETRGKYNVNFFEFIVSICKDNLYFINIYKFFCFSRNLV